MHRFQKRLEFARPISSTAHKPRCIASKWWSFRPMTSYDAANYDPPAPVAEVMLRDISSGAVIENVLLLVDTGADTTLLPSSAGVTSSSCPHHSASSETIALN